MRIFAHRGLYGCTDIGQDFLRLQDVKGNDLSKLPPENSFESIKAAFEKGFSAEVDVVMTQDRNLIVTHSNILSLHSKDVLENEFASSSLTDRIKRIKTGIGGKTSDFLFYDDLMNLFANYPKLNLNVEIKGTIMPKTSLPELQNPSLIEKLAEKTPDILFGKIIWSSFSTSNLIKMKKLRPHAKTAQLFTSFAESKDNVYPDTDDKYLSFNIENIKNLFNRISIDAVHPTIDSLNDENVKFCSDNNITIRAWVPNEKNPDKNEQARYLILQAAKFADKYKNIDIDIITDYAEEVSKII